MKPPDTAARLGALTAQIIAARLAATPTGEEADWIESFRNPPPEFFAAPDSWAAEDEIECRRLFWEMKLGIADWIDAPLDPDVFVSEEAYRVCAAMKQTLLNT